MQDNTPKETNVKRLLSLEVEKEGYEKKLHEVEQWLMKNYNHPDRMVKHDDRRYYMLKIHQAKEKMANVEQGRPENGYSTAYEEYASLNNSLNRSKKQS